MFFCNSVHAWSLIPVRPLNKFSIKNLLFCSVGSSHCQRTETPSMGGRERTRKELFLGGERQHAMGHDRFTPWLQPRPVASVGKVLRLWQPSRYLEVCDGQVDRQRGHTQLPRTGWTDFSRTLDTREKRR